VEAGAGRCRRIKFGDGAPIDCGGRVCYGTYKADVVRTTLFVAERLIQFIFFLVGFEGVVIVGSAFVCGKAKSIKRYASGMKFALSTCR